METEQVEIEKPSFLNRAMDYVSKKKTQILGGALLAGSMALAGCAIPLEKRVITPNEFVSGRLVTITGEVVPGYKNDSVDIKYPIRVYNSVDTDGNNIDVNILEFRNLGINTQACKRLNEALNNGKYAVRVYGRTTYGRVEFINNGVKKEIINIDPDFISLTDEKGEVKLMLETDMDPIVALMGTNTLPINRNPDLSFGIQWPWHNGFGEMFGSMNWFAWISDWGYGGPCMSLGWNAMWQDWDGDGIPNNMDQYPYDPTNTGVNIVQQAQNYDIVKSNYDIRKTNVQAGLNLHNYISAMKGEKNLILPEEGARLHPDFVNIFAHNREAENYRTLVNAERQKLVKEYNSKSAADARMRNVEPVFNTQSIARSMGIKSDQLNITYNNPHVRSQGLMYERGMGLINAGSRNGGGSMTGGASNGGGGYAIPSAGSNGGSVSTTGGSSTASSGGSSGGGHIRN
jgi:hypothetical protein